MKCVPWAELDLPVGVFMGSCPFLVVSNLLPLSSFSIFEVVSLNCEKNETAKVDTV